MTDTVVISQPVTTTLLYSTEQGPPGFTDVSPVIKLTGDLIANGTTGSAGVLTSLATTGVTAGTYGSSNQLPIFTVDTKGRLTSAANTTIQLNASAIVAGTLGTSLLPAFSGDVSSTEGTATLTLANSGITAGTYDKVTFNSKGIATSGSVVTTIADSGILDVYSKTEVDQAILAGTPSFLTLTNKPITLAGYGINDAYTKAETDALVGSTAVSWSTLTGKPNTIAGYNITDAVSTSMIGTDIASLVSGKIPSTQLPSYVDDVIEDSTLAAFPAIGEIGKIYVALDTGFTYRWSGSAYVAVGGTTTDASALISGTLNAARLPALTGSDVSSTAGSGILVLSNTTVTAGTYKSITVDSKGRVTAGTNPTTLSDYGIIDAQPQLVSGTSIKTINGTSLLGSGDIVITAGAGSFADLTEKPTTISGYGITDAQVTLVSGTNIKTINGISILGSGDIVISGGSGGGGSGTVTSVSGTGTVNGLTLTGTVTSTGNLTLGGTLTVTYAELSGTVPTWNQDTTGNAATVTNGVYTTESYANPAWLTSLDISKLSNLGTGVGTFLGTPSSANLAAAITDETGTGSLVFATTPTITGVREVKVALAANAIDTAIGSYFSKTITAATTFTVTNVASTEVVTSFVLDLTNGGAFTITWWANLKWVAGIAPTLTAAGRDTLVFFTYDAGTTWTGLLAGKDIK